MLYSDCNLKLNRDQPYPNGLTFRIPLVTESVENGHIQLLDMLDFQETETPGNHILNFL